MSLARLDGRVAIAQFLRRLRLSPISDAAQAAHRMAITRPEVSTLLRVEFSYLCERKRMDCLIRLGYGIVIKVRPATKRANHLNPALV